MIDVVEDGVEKTIRLDSVGNRKLSVRSKDLATGEIIYSEITNFAKMSENAKVIRITDDETGATIVCTPDHEIYTKNRGWLRASELLPYDVLDIS